MTTPNIDVTKLDISPNNCPFQSELSFEASFFTDAEIKNAIWEFQYIVDYSGKRLQVNLGKSEPVNYTVGEHIFKYHVPGIGDEDIDIDVFANVGLLLAILREEGVAEEIIQISMVTQVTKKKNTLYRTIFNPLE